ncbi:MAG: ATP-binding protein [Aggregatilineales bacterium]
MTLRSSKLEDMDREQLLTTVRSLLAEASALSSRIAAVNEIGVAINKTLNLYEITQVMARQAKWLMDFDHCSVCLKEADDLQLMILFGETPDFDMNALRAARTINLTLETGRSQLIAEASQDDFFGMFPAQMMIPLTGEGHTFGTLNFASKKAGRYTQEDLRIGYMLALQLSTAIQNVRHVRELHEAQESLQQYAVELEARNEELDAYSYTIAHDLKSPLSAALLKAGLLEIIGKQSLPESAHKYIDGIKTDVWRMTNMIDQLLWLATVRNIKDQLVTVDANKVARLAVDRLQHLIDEANIEIEVMPDMPACTGQGQWVEEIFANLISNAIKYMGKDKDIRRISIRGVLKGDKVCYEVEDTGIGITPEDQQRLFTMFTRLHTVEAEGLGLGLSIVHRIVKKLGGELGVESIKGKGSTFWFMLPVASQDVLSPTVES